VLLELPAVDVILEALLALPAVEVILEALLALAVEVLAEARLEMPL
jgi:hypothetical protein